MFKLAPSLLSADFSNLAESVSQVEKGGAKYLHIDIMDGHFVDNLSMGLPVVESIRDKTNLIFDVHLMIENPEKFIDAFAKAGADIISFHYEAAKDPLKLIRRIKELGKKPAVALKMGTPLSEIFGFINELDMILLMLIEPGFGGRPLESGALKRVEDLREYIDRNNLDIDIEVDGGIRLDNVNRVLDAGANVIVAGTAVFAAEDPAAAAREFVSAFDEYSKNK